ncbi:MAG TPA: NAD(P)-dependent oxidoreductase [Candidatus Dormibacteraeota bacterium]|nr:NAD(P)-dependent oxidoreductase [Candidatus Dormibacteraeota bacterium]
MTTRVAVLGTGKMGGAIARRLKKGGFEVSVWDRTKSKAEALGVGPVADSPADAAQGADVVVSMVTGPQAVRDVYFGQNGVFEASSNKTIVDMSTTGPGIAQELARGAELSGARLIEAPVIGSTPAVNSGSLFILAGAALVEDLEAARPVLEQLGEVHYVGDLGSAAALKLVANSFLGIVSTGAAELIAAGAAHGLDPEEVVTVLARIWPGLKLREAGFVKHVHEPTMFAMRDLLKDLDLALALYRSAVPSPVPLTSLTRELVASVESEAPDLDISAIVKAYASDPTLARQSKEVA